MGKLLFVIIIAVLAFVCFLLLSGQAQNGNGDSDISGSLLKIIESNGLYVQASCKGYLSGDSEKPSLFFIIRAPFGEKIKDSRLLVFSYKKEYQLEKSISFDIADIPINIMPVECVNGGAVASFWTQGISNMKVIIYARINNEIKEIFKKVYRYSANIINIDEDDDDEIIILTAGSRFEPTYLELYDWNAEKKEYELTSKIEAPAGTQSLSKPLKSLLLKK